MKSLQVELPDRLAEELTRMVRDGWARSEDEVVRTAIAEYLRTRYVALQEWFQHADIVWAVAEAKPCVD